MNKSVHGGPWVVKKGTHRTMGYTGWHLVLKSTQKGTQKVRDEQVIVSFPPALPFSLPLAPHIPLTSLI